MVKMKISKKDTLMCITSAGDNALHYAVAGRPKRIHCVDSRHSLIKSTQADADN